MRRQALAEEREPDLRLRRRAGAGPAAALEAAEAAALRRLLLAIGIAFVATAVAYLLLGVTLAASARWSGEVALDQAVGLAVHAGVVFARGVLPAVLVAEGLVALWRRLRAAEPGALATIALSLVVAAPVAYLLLTAPIAHWPRLQVQGAPNAVVTALLLGAVAGGAELLARRRSRRRGAA